MDWQKSLIRSMVDHRIIWLEIARKNGKSATIAMVAIAHMLAGYKNKTNPQVILAAATREQATILLNYCKNTIYFTAGRIDPVTKKSLDLSSILKPFRGEIRIKGMPGFLKTITSDGGSNHGLNPSLILGDEIHAWKEPGGAELWEALRTSMGARPLSKFVAITTAGSAYSFAHGLHNYADKVAKKEIKDSAWLPIIYKADEDEEYNDPKAWAKANPSLGVTVTHEYLEDVCRMAAHDEVTRISFKKLHLNQWTGSSKPYIEFQDWDKCSTELDIDNSWRCFLGCDFAAVNDFTAYVLLFFNDDGQFHIKEFYQITEMGLTKRSNKYPQEARNWIANGNLDVTPGDAATSETRLKMVNSLISKYDIERVFFDPWNASETIMKLEGIYGEKMLEAVHQSAKYMSEPMKLLYKLVKTGKVSHEKNPVTRWMIGNTELHIDRNENWMFDKSKAHEKIDGTAALVTALAGYIHYQNSTSFYDKNDIVFLGS
jgi:phage terminase large subunit-like protein